MKKFSKEKDEWQIEFLNAPPIEQLEFLYRYNMDILEKEVMSTKKDN